MTDWAIEYVRRVLRELDITPTELAKRADVSSTTLTRPLNPQSGHPYAISRRTLEKIRAVTGIAFPGEATTTKGDGDDQILIMPIDRTNRRNYADSRLSISKDGAVSFSPAMLAQLTESPPEQLGMVTIRGDSMKPTLLEGDQVLVDRGQASLDFDGLYAIRFGNAIQVKRIGRHRNKGWVRVISDNESYGPVEATGGDLDVVGRVLWIGRRV